jgi:hypothetical protein
MTIETIEKNLALLREQFGYEVEKLENQLAALKKPAEVQYRPAEWPRDWNRADAECRDGESDRWEVERLIGFDKQDPEQAWSCASSAWYRECRVPILPGDEYREPLLPQDAGKECEFSDDGVTWALSKLLYWNDNPSHPWQSKHSMHRFCRIRTGATA